jgi:hypothetical protein
MLDIIRHPADWSCCQERPPAGRDVVLVKPASKRRLLRVQPASWRRRQGSGLNQVVDASMSEEEGLVDKCHIAPNSHIHEPPEGA